MQQMPTSPPRRSSRGILLGGSSPSWTWSGHQRSALILGPTRSGKTSSVIVPNVIAAPGAVVTTSTKADILEATLRARLRSGSVLMFDPFGSTPAPPDVVRIGWSPLHASRSWDGALLMASSMVTAAHQRSAQGRHGADHWSERSASLLAPILFAAACANRTMAEVVQWVDRHHGSDALIELESSVGSNHPAPALLSGILATDSREQSGSWSTTSGVLGAYRSLGALRSTEGPVLDPRRFVEGNHTLHICAPGRQQALIAPLVVGLLSEIQTAAYERGDVHRPVLFALDELANIAPLPDLPQLVSEGGGQGLLTIGCLQDLSQARTRWGAEADGLLSLFSTTLLLGGIADRATIRSFSDLAGPTEIARHSHSISGGQRRRPVASLTTSSSREQRLDVDEVSRGRPGHGLLLDAHNHVGWVQLTVAHRDEPWRMLTRVHDRATRSRDR